MRYTPGYQKETAQFLNHSAIRKAHRWLGIVAAIQLLIWTGSGLFFSIIPIEKIRGSHLIEQPPIFRLGHVKVLSPNVLARQYQELSAIGLDQIQLNQRLNTPVYIIRIDDRWLVFNAVTAKQLSTLTEREARAIAAKSTNLAVRSATWVTAIKPGSEYRGGELPAWKLSLDSIARANLWIGAYSGQVTAVRTSQWRIYDFLWSLHIMDYVDRDNFNSWLLRAFALLGLSTILSGIILFILRLRLKKRSS